VIEISQALFYIDHFCGLCGASDNGLREKSVGPVANESFPECVGVMTPRSVKKVC
jgi:hypothetical protein